VQQGEKSMKKNEDFEPVNAHLPTDMMANVSIQQVENDELGVEPDKIDEQSEEVIVNQKDDEETSDDTAVKEQVTGVERPVKKLFFKFDSVDIETDYLAELKEVAGQLDASPETSALIIGYSDNVGDKNYNLTLSMKRARAVASFLASQDISTNRLRTDGRGIYPGEIRSESNSEETVSDLSRMVEIYLIPAVNQE
jgi:OOP family OmpA-OmpF porin